MVGALGRVAAIILLVLAAGMVANALWHAIIAMCLGLQWTRCR